MVAQFFGEFSRNQPVWTIDRQTAKIQACRPPPPKQVTVAVKTDISRATSPLHRWSDAELIAALEAETTA